MKRLKKIAEQIFVLIVFGLIAAAIASVMAFAIYYEWKKFTFYLNQP